MEILQAVKEESFPGERQVTLMEENRHNLNHWTDILENQIVVTGDVRIEDVGQALAHITEEADQGLYGRCCFYKAFYCLRRSKAAEALPLLNEAIRCMVGTEQERHVSRCYNLLGIIAHGRNNLLLAAEQYDKALDYAGRYQNAYMRNVAGSNLADVYFRLGVYDKAFWWYRESMEQYEKSGNDTANGAENYMMLLSGYGYCLAMTGRLKKAEEIRAQLEQLRKGKHAESFPLLCAYTFFAMLYYKEERAELASACLNVAVQSVMESRRILQNVDSVLNLIALLIMQEKYGYLGELLDYLEPIAREEQNEGLLLQILVFLLKYCSDKMTTQQYLARTKDFFSIKEGYEKRENAMILHMMEMRKQLLQIEEDQRLLKEQNAKLYYQAEHDELSGLYNKGKLNRYAEELFDVAHRNGYALSVFFIDIDEFKQLNDRYGHRMGDECVRTVADCIRECFPGEFAARYGGDEFVVLALDRTGEYARECGEHIVRQVRQRQPEGGQARLTVTVGIAHAVPEGKNRIWDFLAAADATLYEQKNEKRGCMRFCDTVGTSDGDETI